MPNVNYAASYQKALAQMYPYLSYFAAIWASPNSTKYKEGMGKTMYIPSLTVTGAKDVDRNSIDGNFNRNWDNQWQAVELQMDRYWDTLADPQDIDETNEVASMANIADAFIRQQKIPEMDCFMASKLAEFARIYGGTTSASLSASTILGVWDDAIQYMTDQRVNRDRLICYMVPAVYKLLKQAAGLTRFIEVTTGIRAVDRNVDKLDGVTIVEVPADMMQTAYDFSIGWVKASGAQQINFVFVDPEAVAAPIKYETAMMSPPTAQSKGKWLYFERYYYGAFILNQRGAGVYAHIGTAPTAGVLNVTSVAGTATAGDTVISVEGDGIVNGQPGANLEMYYCTGESAAVSYTYGAVPNANKTWVKFNSPVVIAGQTAGKHCTVVLVNKETGYVVAGGDTTLVVKT